MAQGMAEGAERKGARAKATESATREQLIEAGVRLFGLHGFGATSTRSLALEAGVNLAAIVYHFGGKEGLYRAVAERVVATKRREVGPVFEAVRQVCADPASGREQVLEAMRGMIRGTVRVMLGTPETRLHSNIMLQEQILPTPAFDILHEGFFSTVFAVWETLLHRLTGLAPGSTEIRLRALAMVGQMVIFRVGMRGAVRLLGVERLEDQHLEAITRLTIQHVESALANFAPVCVEDKA